MPTPSRRTQVAGRRRNRTSGSSPSRDRQDVLTGGGRVAAAGERLAARAVSGWATAGHGTDRISISETLEDLVARSFIAPSRADEAESKGKRCCAAARVLSRGTQASPSAGRP